MAKRIIVKAERKATTENGRKVVRFYTQHFYAICGWGELTGAYTAFFYWNGPNGNRSTVKNAAPEKKSLAKVEAYAERKIKQLERKYLKGLRRKA